MKEKSEWKKEIELNIKLHNLFKEYIENYGGDAKSADSLDYVVIDNWQAFLYWQRTYLYETLISKKFGMVKWLVDNDKIDTDKVIDTAKSSVIDTYYYEEGIDDIYIPLLMVLAVKDEPIEYLLSVIK